MLLLAVYTKHPLVVVCLFVVWWWWCVMRQAAAVIVARGVEGVQHYDTTSCMPHTNRFSVSYGVLN